MNKAQLMQVGHGLFALTDSLESGGEYNYYVPRGFITDFYSIPRSFWWRYAPHELAVEPSIIHDYYLGLEAPSKRVIDDAFYYLMIDYGVPERDARLFYTAVRRFGGREISQAEKRVRGLLNTKELEMIKNDYTGVETQSILIEKEII